MTNQDVFGDTYEFFDSIMPEVQKLGIDVTGFPIDHVCYRVCSFQEYEKMKTQLKKISKSFLENFHHERFFSKFILLEPIVYKDYKIEVVELPAPKKTNKYKTGLEHFEMVVGNDFENFKNKYKTLWTGQNDSGPYNQPVYITFPNEKTIKFHEHPILKVVELEGKTFTPCQ